MSEFKREITDQLKLHARNYRVVTLLGPRQAGKTTICKMSFPGYAYVSVENPESRALAKEDPKSFLARYQSPVIIDEIQRVPELLSWIQGIVDDAPDTKGQFILTGSHEPLLRESVSQSLAGRTSILTLLPLSISELKGRYEFQSASEAIFRGFLPEIYRANLDPLPTYRSYFQTYIERDVRQLIQLKDQSLFERFLKLCAGRIGQLLNMNSLASDVGVSPKTVAEWLSVLEASFIVVRVVPYFKNFGKRIVKAPKLYFTDIGLASYLLGLKTTDQVERDPLFGQLFENLVVIEILKKQLNNAGDSDLYFFRDSHGQEIDLLLTNGSNIRPVEIKSSSTYNQSLVKNLNRFVNSMKDNTESPTLIFSGETGPLPGGITGFNFRDAGDI